MRLSTLPVLLALAAPGFSQTISPVAFESFDYTVGLGIGNGNGFSGSGWMTEWWSGNAGDHGVITTPGFDTIGHKLTTNIENQGTFRLPDAAPHLDIAPNGKFGSTDAVMWFRFRTQRIDPAGDVYGGFSLFTQFGAEHIFIGCPGNAEAWGMEDPATLNRVTVAGSDPDVQALLVCRITFTDNGETADLWVDPASNYPTTTPDATMILGDFDWNEVRFQSGVTMGGPSGWDFDELVIEKETGGGGGGGGTIGSNYCIANPNSTGGGASISAVGSTTASLNFLTLEMNGLPLNQFCLFIASRQAGFVANPGGAQGNLCVGSPIARFGPVAGYSLPNSGSTGMVDQQIDLTSIPLTPAVGVLPGETWYFQGWYRDNNPTPTSNFSNGLSITFQ